MLHASKHTNPGLVQCKSVTLYKRDQKRGGSGNVQQYRLAIHLAVVASQDASGGSRGSWAPDDGRA